MDEYIEENNPVRLIDAYVESINLVEYGFKYAITKPTSRSPHNPGDLLKCSLSRIFCLSTDRLQKT